MRLFPLSTGTITPGSEAVREKAADVRPRYTPCPLVVPLVAVEVVWPATGCPAQTAAAAAMEMRGGKGGGGGPAGPALVGTATGQSSTSMQGVGAAEDGKRKNCSGAASGPNKPEGGVSCRQRGACVLLPCFAVPGTATPLASLPGIAVLLPCWAPAGGGSFSGRGPARAEMTAEVSPWAALSLERSATVTTAASAEFALRHLPECPLSRSQAALRWQAAAGGFSTAVVAGGREGALEWRRCGMYGDSSASSSWMFDCACLSRRRRLVRTGTAAAAAADAFLEGGFFLVEGVSFVVTSPAVAAAALDERGAGLPLVSPALGTDPGGLALPLLAGEGHSSFLHVALAAWAACTRAGWVAGAQGLRNGAQVSDGRGVEGRPLWGVGLPWPSWTAPGPASGARQGEVSRDVCHVPQSSRIALGRQRLAPSCRDLTSLRSSADRIRHAPDAVRRRWQTHDLMHQSHAIADQWHSSCLHSRGKIESRFASGKPSPAGISAGSCANCFTMGYTKRGWAVQQNK